MHRAFHALLLLFLISACATDGDDAPTRDTTAADQQRFDAAGEDLVTLECESGTPFCDGEAVVRCVDGEPERTPCATDTYCNFGECVPASITLPADAGFHDERTEWWYYTGHVSDGERRWGFEVTIFQYNVQQMFGKDELGYMCHVAVTDKDAGAHYHTDSITLTPRAWTADPLVLEVDNCRFELGGDGRDHIVGVIPAGQERDYGPAPWRVDLSFEPQKRPAFHGADGIIPMADTGGTSWYYSYTRLGATGTLTTPEGAHEVDGEAWMDHQWGQFDLFDFKGWDWWSLQLDDGYELMLFQFTDWDDNLATQAGTIVDPEGNLTPLEGMEAFSITSLREWPSPHTDGTYPLDWDIAIPEGNWQIAVRTSVDDQEVHNPAQNYWEGETTVTGTRGAAPISGHGYTELTGYATDALDPR